MAAIGLALLAGLFMAGPRFETGELVFMRPAILATAMLLLPALFVAYARLRGCSRVHTVLGPFALMGAIGLFVTAYAMLGELNRELDVSQPRSYGSHVLEHHVSHGRHSTSYYLILQRWHPGPGTTRLHVPYEMYARFHNGDPVTVQEHEGYLSQPWVASITRGELTDP
jgi:hypothetical protein